MNSIKILPLYKDDLGKSGIYIIWFGWKFYIGATMDSRSRMQTHISSIKRRLNGIDIGKNSATNIANYLKRNQFIKIAHFKMLEYCDCELDLVDAEHKWLSPHEGNPNCLNQVFKVHRTIGDIIFRPNGDFKIKNVVSNQ